MKQVHRRTSRRVAVFLAEGLALLLSIAFAEARQTPSAAPRPSTTRVLFLCPHGAAKSVLASAYFRRLAQERGLNVVVDSAGTEPDSQVSPAVSAHLTGRGYPAPTEKPRQVTPEDLAKADVVVSLGCDLAGSPAPSGTLLKWDDVPGPSEDFAGADEAIRRHVTALVDDLAKQVKGQRN
jgi:protein-tyrosine-phosphatase